MKNETWDKAYAYIVGLDQYEHLSPLHFCKNDAKVFSETISNVIPNIKNELLDGKEFTIEKSKAILKEIETIDEKEKSSILFFYYAGHGFSHGGQDYLTCYNTNKNDLNALEETSISTTDLIDATNKSGINTVVMIFDACRTIPQRDVAIDPFGKLTAEISNRKGIISFFSCSLGESSQELFEIGHGIYTYSLIEAIRGCQYRTPLAINKSVIEKVNKLVTENNLEKQTPSTTTGPIEKGNLDIISGKEIHYENEKKTVCILIAGSTHAGKSDIGRYLAQQYNFGHYEMSALAYQHYEDFKKTVAFDGTIQDFLEIELWAKDENKGILMKDLLEKYDGSNNIIISGPRLIEEVETLLSKNNDLNIIPLYIYSEAKLRLDRFNTLQKDHAFFAEVTYKEFIRKDMRELYWGLAKMATMNNFEMVMNNGNIEDFYNKVKEHTDAKLK